MSLYQTCVCVSVRVSGLLKIAQHFSAGMQSGFIRESVERTAESVGLIVIHRSHYFSRPLLGLDSIWPRSQQ